MANRLAGSGRGFTRNYWEEMSGSDRPFKSQNLPGRKRQLLQKFIPILERSQLPMSSGANESGRPCAPLRRCRMYGLQPGPGPSHRLATREASLRSISSQEAQDFIRNYVNLFRFNSRRIRLLQTIL